MKAGRNSPTGALHRGSHAQCSFLCWLKVGKHVLDGGKSTSERGWFLSRTELNQELCLGGGQGRCVQKGFLYATPVEAALVAPLRPAAA